MDHVALVPRAESVGNKTSMCEPGTTSANLPSVSMEAEQTATALMKRHPGSLVWFGTRTRHWWAFVMLRGAWTLLEAQTVEEIAQVLMTPSGRGLFLDGRHCHVGKEP